MTINNNSGAQVLLITGTSKGIGRYVVEHYCHSGYIVIGCSRTKIDLKHDNYHHLYLDISEEKDILEIYKFIREKYKRLDILINNAAINPAIISAALLPYSTIEKVFKVNVYAPMLFCREAIKLMTRNKYGRIINIGSMASRHEVPGEALYTSTKTAMIAYTRVLAKEIYKLGITVNMVAPAAIKTELSSKIDQQALTEVLSRNAIPGSGELKDVTNTLDFLFKNDSSSITGQIIYLGGV